MDTLVNKPFLIGVAIFITLAITSGILIVFNSVYEIYQKVYTTDISVSSKFGEYAMYEGTVMSGLELYNTVKKYNNNMYVSVYVNSKLATVHESSDIIILNGNTNDRIDPNYSEDTKVNYNVSYVLEDDFCKINFIEI